MSQTNLETVLHILQSLGHEQYGGEPVSQLEHALQCASLAQDQGADPELITACLFHDLGHLVSKLGENAAVQGYDNRHEYIVIPWLKDLFSSKVIEPIRLHVQAKRYLCLVKPGYYSELSAASQQSLALQGGIFSVAEAEDFIKLPDAENAIQLRLWDEQAKVPGKIIPTLHDFIPIVHGSILV